MFRATESQLETEILRRSVTTLASETSRRNCCHNQISGESRNRRAPPPPPPPPGGGGDALCYLSILSESPVFRAASRLSAACASSLPHLQSFLSFPPRASLLLSFLLSLLFSLLPSVLTLLLSLSPLALQPALLPVLPSLLFAYCCWW